jgi:tetratricopeptide (TPR) repeat protein/opacity protein-like surface antigen
VAILVALAGLDRAAMAAETAGSPIATLEAPSGGITVVRLGLSQPVSPGMALLAKDVVVTRHGRATVRFRSDGSMLRIGPDSRVEIDERAKKREVTLFFGRVWAHVVRAQERLTRFKSRGTIAAIRGTEISLGMAADGDETVLAVIEGTVDAQNDAGMLTLAGGQAAVSKAGSKPALAARVSPRDAVQWALYYPPVVSIDVAGLGDGPWQASVRESADAASRGDLQRALDVLAAVDEQSVQDPRFFTWRASRFLAAGNVEAADKDLARALDLDAKNAGALALRTILAVANNATDAALASGRKAVAADAKSATAQVALSYAQQAAFDLDGARASLERAVALDAGDALAWARLAEIRSSQGHLDEALAAARRASDLEPNLSRTQTVLGFAHLLRLHTHEAKGAFREAIKLDANDPLPRLGLGLAQIREGHLDEGSKNLEVAVSLDPGSAVIRSYLGKAYFEAKRRGLDEREYDVAKTSDPKDPTPWFYDAITLQTTNRPAEALDSAEKSIELNDNRAVYRSRLLLDSDHAARGAGLGRVYSDLGFQDRALVEGWLSVNTDQTNFSAHRFLADSYGAMPRHEIARVSELFQSQMLQPANRTPIQPRLGESNQLLMNTGGPSALGFNEFNPLFSRNGASLQAGGMEGTQDTWSGEGMASVLVDKVSVSGGYSRFETDGWRENAFQEDQIANGFVQADLTPNASVQAEYRFRDQSFGDLQQRVRDDPGWILLGQDRGERRHTARLGGRYSLSPGNIVLGSFTFQDSESTTRIEVFPDFIDFKAPQQSMGPEVQHLYRSRLVNLTTGVGYFKIDGEFQTIFGAEDVFVEPPGIGVTPGFEMRLPDEPTEFGHLNLYTYANVKPIRPLVITAGVSYDRLDPSDQDEFILGDGQSQVNPKLGAMWNPWPTTTVRAALLRTLKRTLVTDQTLEPTQVAGFNQFYDDTDLTSAWRYGGGVDQKIGRKLFGGVEYSRRDLTVPFEDPINFPMEPRLDADWKEEVFRAYVFAIPHRWFGLRVQYLFEDLVRERRWTAFEFLQMETHRVPLGITFFHPLGLTASYTLTYWHQRGQFTDPTAGFDTFPPTEVFLNETTDFWLSDASLGYRLPRRYGVVSVNATNLGDEDFDFHQVDRDNPTILPVRSVFAKLTLAVP